MEGAIARRTMDDTIMKERQTTAEQMPPASGKRGSSFARDVAKLVSGTTFAQALSLLVAPILSRIYAPDAYGTATVFASITTVVGVIACLRFEQAVMLPERDEVAANLLTAALLITLVISGLSLVLILSAGGVFSGLLNATDLEPYLWLVPVAVLFKGGFLALNYWNSRKKRFGLMSISQVVQSASINGLELGVGVAGFAQAGGLIGSRVLGSIAGTMVLGGQTWRDDGRMLRQHTTLRGMMAAISRYRKFPLYSTWSALLNSISWQLPTFLLSAFFSSAVVGWYALGTRVLRLPMSLIGDAIARVFFQRAAESQADGSLSKVVEGVFGKLVTLVMFPLMLLTIVGRELFVIVFGENWAEAGVYAQILSPWTLFWFVSSPLSTLFSVLERQEFSLAVNLVILATRFLSLAIGGVLGSARVGLILFSASGVMVYGYYTVMLMAAAGVPWRRVIGILASNLAQFAPAGGVLLILKVFGVHPMVQVAASVILLGIWALFILRTDPELRQVLGQFRILKRSGDLRSSGEVR